MMARRMLTFVDVEQRPPQKRAAGERLGDFAEIHADFLPQAALEQASRCSQCGVPYCQIHCPLENNIPDWLQLTAEGRFEEAYHLAQATNPLPEVCGRICPQDRLCEGNCVIEKGFQSVTIGSVERFITDMAWKEGWIRPSPPRRLLDQSVGIIGGGPAGIAAADRLRSKGYGVHVYDRYDRIGGLLVYGIPSFKLEKDVVARRIDLLARNGVEFYTEFEVGRHAAFQELRERHDALLIATGVYKSRDIQAPGAGLKGIHPAMTYLTASNRKGLGDSVPDFDNGELDAKDKHVVVIGGGDTAMDCVRTAVRQGATSVKCLYRRDRENMPGSRKEVQYATEEGVEFVWLTAPQAFLGDHQVSGVRALRMRLTTPDSSGRQTPEPIDGSAHTIKADLVLTALGFDPEDLHAMFDMPELALTRWGTVQAHVNTMETNLPGVYAAGDIVRGASLVVWAVRDGLQAADSIDSHLRAKRRVQAEAVNLTRAS